MCAENSGPDYWSGGREVYLGYTNVMGMIQERWTRGMSFNWNKKPMFVARIDVATYIINNN
ncbi:hypothetical protein CK934_22790 [Chitinophaga sp. MD30]|nr:hypothetical protein CK934_22790 [Chitinophaga sp. MD30]